MSFDDAARQAADALGSQLNRAFQEHLQQFVSQMSDAAARERSTLTEQAQQAVSAAEQTLADAVARAREEATHAAEARFDIVLAERAAQIEADLGEQRRREAAEASARTSELETALATLQQREAELTEHAARLEAEAATRASHEAERAEWADRASRLEADLTERQLRDADLVARAQHAEAELARAEAELAARAERFDAQLAEQTAEVARLMADAERARDSAVAAGGAGEDATTDSEADAATPAAGATSGLRLVDLSASSAPAPTGREIAGLADAAASRAAAGWADSLARLVSGFRALDEGQSLSHLLDTLAAQIARNAPRTAIFVVRGQPRQGAVLQGWAFAGFNGAPLDARSLSVPLDKLPALAEVVKQGGRSDVLTAGFAAADVNPLAFMSVPRTQVGVAVPVLVGGQVAAVVYGDDGVPAHQGGLADEYEQTDEREAASAGYGGTNVQTLALAQTQAQARTEAGEAAGAVAAGAASHPDGDAEANVANATGGSARAAGIVRTDPVDGDAASAGAHTADADAGSPGDAAAFSADVAAGTAAAANTGTMTGATQAVVAAIAGRAAGTPDIAGGIGWADALELLARHAARCLEAQTAIRAARLSSSAQPAPVIQPAAAPEGAAGASAAQGGATASGAAASPADSEAAAEAEAAAAYAEEHARRYARLLISDIRLYNEAAVRAGREHRDLWHRLQPDIARARRAFEDRVNDVADRERLFDEELVRTLADGDEALLGFDLVRPIRAASASATASVATAVQAAAAARLAV